MVQIAANPETPRDSRSARRRSEILRAASQVFRRRGLHATGMREIATEAGMHVGNLYYYFRNKQELLAYCQKQTLAGLLERAETISRSSLPPDAKLFWLIVEHVVQLNEITPGSLAHLDVEALDQPLRRQILAHRDRYEAGLRSLVEEGIRVGLFRPVDPKVTVMAVLGATNWTVKWYKPGGDRSIQGIGREFAAMLVRGLLTEGRELSDPKMFDRSKAHEHT